MFSMLGIVLANNFVMMFIFWELVGLSSYLLIGHWFERDSRGRRGEKAFITNRIGDFGFMLGILMVWVATGSVVFGDIAELLATSLQSGISHRRGAADFLRCGRKVRAISAARLVAGCDGRPDAGLRVDPRRDDGGGRRLHARARVFFLIRLRPTRSRSSRWIGTITALLAALIATQQNDIKRILAYSTLSQLGYMIMAVGSAARRRRCSISSPTPSSRRCSSSAPASVIHRAAITSRTSGGWAASAGKMLVTFVTFRIGTLALIGCPPFSGFFQQGRHPLRSPMSENSVDFLLGPLHGIPDRILHDASCVVVVFFGKPRSPTLRSTAMKRPPVMTVPLSSWRSGRDRRLRLFRAAVLAPPS